MSLALPSNPSVRDIFSVGIPSFGEPAGPTSGFDMEPPQPGIEWDPTTNPVPTSLSSWNGGPKIQDSMELDAVNFIQQAFLVPPWLDDSDQYMMPEMLCYAVNEVDPYGEGCTHLMTLAKVNQVMHDAQDDFERARDPSDPVFEDDAALFETYLTKFGEQALLDYHFARENFHNLRDKPGPVNDLLNNAELSSFYEMSTRKVFCWLTLHGIMQKITFVGAIINMNRGTTLEERDNTQNEDHYVHVNVSIAKHTKIHNVFGSAERITTGSKLWLCLKRKMVVRKGEQTYREFQIIPGGAAKEDVPHRSAYSYVDPSGRAMSGWVWRLGTVIAPGKGSPQPGQIKAAVNIGIDVSEKRAYQMHGSLPSLTVALSIK